MANSSNGSNSATLAFDPEISLSFSVRFWLFLFFDILSIVCSLFVLYYLLGNRTLRQALHNHVIIVLLIIGLLYELTDISWILYYYRFGTAWHRTPIFCLIWTFIDYGLYAIQLILFAWASIERHILIFHDRWLSTRKKRFFVHYLPTIIILLYCLLFYSLVTLFPFCKNLFNYSLIGCMPYVCTFNNPVLNWWETICHQILPTLIVFSVNIALLVRILYRKRHFILASQWRKHRKMTIQLLSISVLYFFFYIPSMLFRFLYLVGVSNDFGADIFEYSEYFSYYVIFLFPFVIAGSLPGLRTKINRRLPCCRQQIPFIAPQAFVMMRRAIAVEPILR